MDPMIDCVDRLAPFLRVAFFEVKIKMGIIIFGGMKGGEVVDSFAVVIENSDGGVQRFHLFKDGKMGDGDRFFVSGMAGAEGEF